jgi:hypothetical protein
MMIASSGSDTPGLRPRISLTTFTEYLAANTSARVSCVQRQRETYGQRYVPGGDFYADMIRAFHDGRSNGADALVSCAGSSLKKSPE